MSLQATQYTISEELLSLTQDQVAHLDQQSIEGEGWQFYCNGFVSGATVFQNKLIGQVRELTAVNFVEIKFRGQEIYASCSCSRTGGICRHAIALLYSWVNDADSFLNVGKSMNELQKLDKSQLLKIVRRIIIREPKFLSLALGRDADDDDDLLNEDIFI